MTGASRTRRRAIRLALLAPALLLATAAPAHANYLRVFVGSQSYEAGVDADRVETRIRDRGTQGARWLVQERTLAAADDPDLSHGEIEAATFGPLRLGTYEVIVILWDDGAGVWRAWKSVDVPVSGLGSGDPVVWLGTPPVFQPPSLIDVTKTDALSVDLDGDGEVTVGDEVAYTVTVTNVGATPDAGVFYEEHVNPFFQGQLFVNEATATMTKQGSPPSTSAVTFDFDPPGGWIRRINADIGTLDPGQWATVEFEVAIGQLGTLSRGYAWVDGDAQHPSFPRAVVSDDPGYIGSEDLTFIPLSFAGPNLCRAQLPIALDNASDLDGDAIIRIDEIALGTNPDDADTDADGLDDGQELLGPDGVEGTGDETDPLDDDSDDDGALDGSDNCVLLANASQANDDGDAWGNACDGCPDVWNGERADLDRDGVWDACDVCSLTHDPDQLDAAGFPSATPDGVGNACQSWDFDGDGRADGADVAAMRHALAEIDPPPDVAMPPRGCAPGVAEQAFTPEMSGCEGTVAWADRATLCATGWSACTAAEWVARRHGKQPTANYWTDDELRFGGTAGACWVHETLWGACNPGVPMRVCAGSADHLGNTCNWTGCGYQSAPPPNEYFGGCAGNPTAGTLCCR